MIDKKQRLPLRSLAMGIEDTVQIGKEGLTNNVLESIKQVLSARELIKIKVLKNCSEFPKDIANTLVDTFGCDIVTVIGSKVVVYKRSERKDIKHIEIWL